MEGNPVHEVSLEETEKAINKIKKRIEKSSRNARKNTPSKPIKFSRNPSSIQSVNQAEQETNLFYPERVPAFSMQNPLTPSRSASVFVKKSSRQFDPDAVARLKEKLGLSRKSETEEESR